MLDYEAEALYGMARRMQSRAQRVIWSHVASYMFLGTAVGIGVWYLGPRVLGGLSWLKSFAWWTAIPAMIVFFAWQGYLRGRSVSSNLRFEAQRTFCQIKIEEHLADIVRLLTPASASSLPTNTPSCAQTTSGDKKPKTGQRKKGQ